MSVKADRLILSTTSFQRVRIGRFACNESNFLPAQLKRLWRMLAPSNFCLLLAAFWHCYKYCSYHWHCYGEAPAFTRDLIPTIFPTTLTISLQSDSTFPPPCY